MKRNANYRSRQRGAVLVVSLIMLVVMTLLVVSMMKTSVLDLKIGGLSQQASVNLANADVALNQYLVANPTLSKGCLEADTCRQGFVGTHTTTTYNGVQYYTAGSITLYGTTVALAVSPTGCVPGGQRGTGSQVGSLPSIFFDARAAASGMYGGIATTGETVVHQGVNAFAPVGTC